MSVFDDDFRDTLAADMQAMFGGEGSYARNGVTLTGVAYLSTSEEVIDADHVGGFTVESRIVMFRIMADALGDFDKPLKGDRFTVDGVVHEVLPESGSPAWQYSGSGRFEIVFRTKVVS